MAKKTDIEVVEKITNPLSDIIAETQYNVLAVITKRIRDVGKVSVSDVQRLSQLVRISDLKEIEQILSDGLGKSIKEVDNIINLMAMYNDNLATNLYKARNMSPSDFLADSSLLNIVETAKKSIKDGIVNLSKTTGFLINGKMSDIAETYNYAINKAVFEVQQGLFDYNTVVRSTIAQLASGGIKTVDYESGYHRRLDSSVMTNVQDGIRQVNVEYRKRQGEQFGADGVELSAHALSEPIHARYQGRRFSTEEFERLQASLERPFFTMNCKHSLFPIILGIGEPVYSDKTLKEYQENSAKEVEYTTLKKGSDGKYEKKTLAKYDATQKQRQVETDIRKMKDVRNQLSLAGDDIGVAEYNKKIKQKTKYYKYISKEMGLDTDDFRLRVYMPKN